MCGIGVVEWSDGVDEDDVYRRIAERLRRGCGSVGKGVVCGPIACEVDGEECAEIFFVVGLQDVFHESESVDDELCECGNATMWEVVRARAEVFPSHAL